jgi:hypothetical protein
VVRHRHVTHGIGMLADRGGVERFYGTIHELAYSG